MLGAVSPRSPTVGNPPPPEARGTVGVGFGRSSLDVTLAGLGFCFGDVPPVVFPSASLGLSAGGGGPAESAPTPVIVGKGAPELTSICGASSVRIPFCAGAGGPGASEG